MDTIVEKFIKAGDDILDSVTHAVDNGDFSRLGDDLRHTVTDTVGSVASGMSESVRNGFFGTKRVQSPTRPPYFTRLVDKNLDKGKRVGGAIGTVACTALAVICLTPSPIIGGAIFFGILDIPFIAMLRKGQTSKRLVDEFYRYGDIIQGRSYIALQELADLAGETKETVLSNIRKMKHRDFLPKATLDHEETTLMLTDDVYREYTRSYLAKKNEDIKKRQTGGARGEATRAKQEAEAILKDVRQTESKESLRSYLTIDESLPADVKTILQEGNTYLNKIRNYNDMVPDTEKFSDQLYTLEATVLSIFKHVKEEPESAGDLRKFMSYYLPTTEKLLQSYVDLYRQNGNLSNVKNSKEEIEDALDVINQAFERMLNSLYQDKSWDISSDISVMKTMMKQDALI